MRERLLKFALTLHPERTLCGGTPPAARARQAGDLQLPGLHLHLRQDSPGQIPDQEEDPARPHAGEAQDDQTGDVAAHASANSQTGTMAVVRRPRLLQLSRSADQCAGTERVPAPCYRPLAAHAAASQPKGSGHMDTDDAAGERLASETDHPPPLAERSLRRHTPEVGAVCGKAARTVLCGGRAMKRAALPLRRQPRCRLGVISSIRARGDFVRFTPRSGPFRSQSALRRSLARRYSAPKTRRPCPEGGTRRPLQSVDNSAGYRTAATKRHEATEIGEAGTCTASPTRGPGLWGGSDRA